MVLNKYRSMADPYLTPVARRLSRVHPDTLSWLAFAFAVLAGVSFWAAGEYTHHLLLLSLVAVLLNAFFDALDGWVARLTGKASARGDFLDHVLDRYADAFIFGGIVLSAYCHFAVGLVAMLGVIFTSYMGTQAMALGLKRDYGGILGRADRLVLLLLAILVQWAWQVTTEDADILTLEWEGLIYPVTVLEALMIWVALAGHVTALQRGVAAWGGLGQLEQDKASGEDEGAGGDDVDDEGGVTVEVGGGDDEASEAPLPSEEGDVGGQESEDAR